MQAQQFLYFKGLFRYEREQSKWILLIRYADNIFQYTCIHISKASL